MKPSLIKVTAAILFLLCILEIITGRTIGKAGSLELYLVSIPIGYGALSAYHSVPKALHHAPFAFNLFDFGDLTRNAADDENEDKSGVRSNYPRIEYGLDLSKFLEMIEDNSPKPVD